MKKISLLFAALMASASCVATDETEGPIDGTEVVDEGDDNVDEAADIARRLYHYRASVQAVTWNPGCGQQPPEGAPPCQFGLSMTFTRKYADLDYKVTTRVNNNNKTLTITLDTFSASRYHLAVLVAPQTIPLEPENLQLGEVYKVKVNDRNGRSLYRGEVATYLAP